MSFGRVARTFLSGLAVVLPIAVTFAVLAWTVNDLRSAKKLLGWGVDCLVTDALQRIRPDIA